MLEVSLFGLSRDRFEADQDRSTLSSKSAPMPGLASPLSCLLQLLLPFSLSCRSPSLAATPGSFSERCCSDTATRLLIPRTSNGREGRPRSCVPEQPDGRGPSSPTQLQHTSGNSR